MVVETQGSINLEPTDFARLCSDHVINVDFYITVEIISETAIEFEEAE